MKHFYSLLTLLFLSSIAMGQIVFESNFETWSSPNEPDDWGGIKTNIQAVNVNQSTDGPTQGTYLVELINLESGHKRFTTQGISLEEGQTYEVEIWAKGDGELRTGLYDNDVDDGDFGFITYNSYEIVDTTDVYSFVQTIVPDTTYDACELILSLRNGTLLVDRVEVRIGEEIEPMPRTISEIQFTTDPDGDSPELGVLVETSGVVTAVADDGYYIQDGTGAWSGVRILDFDNVPSLGDDVTITGTVEENFDFTRITGVQTYTNNGPSTVPSWTELGTFALNDEQYEGVLVRTSGECTAGWNNFEEWFISDGSGDIMINDEMYQFEPTVGTNYQVTGPLNYAFSAFKIEPRDMDDVSVVSSVDELSTLDFSVFPNPVSDFLTVNHDENESVFLQLFDSNGRVVLNERLDTGASNIDIRSLAAGNYTLLLTTAEKATAKKLEIIK